MHGLHRQCVCPHQVMRLARGLVQAVAEVAGIPAEEQQTHGSIRQKHRCYAVLNSKELFFKSFSAESNQPFSLLCLFWSVLVEAASGRPAAE